MSNWMTIFRKGKALMSDLASFRSESPPTETPSTSSHEAAELPMQVFRGLFKISKHIRGFKMLFNVQLATLHLSCLLNGYCDNSVLVCPVFVLY